MAHMIDMTNDRANMAYVGDTPWHRLGTALTGDENLDEWRIAAGLDWTAEKRDLFYRNATNIGAGATAHLPHSVPTHKALVRSDTGDVLSVVGNRYKVVQPGEVMEFFRDLCFTSDSRYKLETAGSLNDGKRIWALASLDRTIRVGGIDLIKPYLLLGTSFDLTTSTFATHTSVRVVCNNTLNMAVGSDAKNSDVRITHAQTFDEAAIKRALGVIEDTADEAIDNFENVAGELIQRNVDDFAMFTYFASLYGPKLENGQNVTDLRVSDFTTGQKRDIDRLIALFRNGPGADMPTAKGTAWGLVNAVTHFEDFDKGKDDAKRLKRSAFGIGKRNKEKAVTLALAA